MTCSTPINTIFANSFRDNFDLPCITDFVSKESLTYGDFARRIARLHLLFGQCGIKPGDKVVVIDDLLATGSTALAACKLVEELGGEVAAVVFAMEHTMLGGIKNLDGYNVHTIIKF